MARQGMGFCNSYPLIRQRFTQLREDMLEEVGIPGNIQKAIVDNHEPNAEGIYPDWADKYFVFKHREFKIVKHLSATAMR
jgi:coproporphyrinogen III oxidase